MVEAMNANSAHTGVQEQALGALMNLGGDEDVRNTIVAAGGSTLILEAMRQHASKVVQMRACGALWALAAGRESRAALVDAGAIPLILNSIRNHPTEPGMIERAACALRGLAGSSDAKTDALAQIVLKEQIKDIIIIIRPRWGAVAAQGNARQRYARRRP